MVSNINMEYLLKYLSSSFFLMDVSTGFNHVLDRSTVKDGDKFLINCNWNVASGGQPLPKLLITMNIFKLSQNESMRLTIFSCNYSNKKIVQEKFNRPWIFRGVETCPNVTGGIHISVEITDANCSDAGVYGCRSQTGNSLKEINRVPFEVTEEIKRDASCYKNTSSALRETSPMLWLLVVEALMMF